MENEKYYEYKKNKNVSNLSVIWRIFMTNLYREKMLIIFNILNVTSRFELAMFLHRFTMEKFLGMFRSFHRTLEKKKSIFNIMTRCSFTHCMLSLRSSSIYLTISQTWTSLVHSEDCKLLFYICFQELFLSSQSHLFIM